MFKPEAGAVWYADPKTNTIGQVAQDHWEDWDLWSLVEQIHPSVIYFYADVAELKAVEVCPEPEKTVWRYNMRWDNVTTDREIDEWVARYNAANSSDTIYFFAELEVE